MIKHMTRGHIEFEFDGKPVTIPGEALLPGHGSPDFVIFSAMLKTWGPPNTGEPLDDATKKRLLAAAVAEMKEIGMTVEID
ncbi:Imm74 family immunity protein [Nannocystis punicea]|uniref:Imm74 family immunity protein n=1 Tax=Nannocystis punicea TaxID=2995304 RepID=A0ABY7H468_9BACT|nr:Imm74 family immunity protein [Nannocystis poenicansa]WAS94047.1 Imm74 family immunity protein [Nannocystis poenicansa]